MRTRLGDLNHRLPLPAVNAWLEGDPARREQFRAKASQRLLRKFVLPPTARREIVMEMALEHHLLDDSVPDLFDVLPPEAPDREWVVEVRGALEELGGRGIHVAVDQCEWVPGPAGWLAIVGVNVSGGTEIHAGDLLRAGFAATRGSDGRLEVVPRLHRALCANGSVMYQRDEPGVLQSLHTVGAAVQHCLSLEVLEREVQRLRVAARVPAAAVHDMLISWRAERRAQAASYHEAARRRQAAERDLPLETLLPGLRTVWDLINRITAAARSESDLLERLDLERDVARILARLHAARPERHAARARTLDASAEIELLDVR